jgi:hypothetical protein
MVKLLTSKRLRNFHPPVSGDNSKFWLRLMIFHYCYDAFIILVGSGFIILGYRFVEKGIKGEIDWIVKAFGNESILKNATPGVFLIVVGLLIILLARDNVEYKGKS